MENLKQAELDFVEEHILVCLFQNAENPQINGAIKSYLAITGKNHVDILNASIKKFEQVVLPFMKDNGYIDGAKLSRLIEARFNKQIPITDFRLIDASRIVEPWLRMLGAFIQ